MMLKCNIDHTGIEMKDSELKTRRLAALDIFDEEHAKGTSGYRTLDETIASVFDAVVEKEQTQEPLQGGRRPFWRLVQEDVLDVSVWEHFKANGKWKQRDSQIAICDEISMSNLPVLR